MISSNCCAAVAAHNSKQPNKQIIITIRFVFHLSLSTPPQMDYNSATSIVNNSSNTGNHYASQISPIDVSNSSITTQQTQQQNNNNNNIPNNSHIVAYPTPKLTPNGTPTPCAQNFQTEQSCMNELTLNDSINSGLKVEPSAYNDNSQTVHKPILSNFTNSQSYNLSPSYYQTYHNSNSSNSNYNIYTSVNGSAQGSSSFGNFHSSTNPSYNLNSTPSSYLSQQDTVASQPYSKSANYDFGSASAYVTSELLYPSNTILHEYFFPNNPQQYYSYPSGNPNGHAGQGPYANNVLSNYMAQRNSINAPGSHAHPPTAAVNINVSCNIAGNGPSSLSSEEHSSQQTTPHSGNHSEHTTSPVAKYNAHSSPVYDYMDELKQSNFANICNNNPNGLYPTQHSAGTHHDTSPDGTGYPTAIQHLGEPEYMKSSQGLPDVRKMSPGSAPGPLIGGAGDPKTEMLAATPHPHGHAVGSASTISTANVSPAAAAAAHAASAGAVSAAMSPQFAWMKVRRNQPQHICKFCLFMRIADVRNFLSCDIFNYLP